jgi:ubiquinone/menaquinone biosynthesis C-methylase UbiE
MKLHVGCGNKKLKGYVNVDISPLVNPDVVCDMEELPLKFKAESVDKILTEHTLEHINDFEKAMVSMWTVLRKGGILKIVVPWAGCNSAFLPDHHLYFSFDSFNPFRKGDEQNYYHQVHFSQVEVSYKFGPFLRWFTPLANRFHWMYENTFMSHLMPARELWVEMVK